MSERLFTRSPENVCLDRRRILAFAIGASPDVVVDVALDLLCEACDCVATSVTAAAMFGVGALLETPPAASLLRLREQCDCAAPAVVVDCNAEADTISDTMLR